MIFQGIFLNVDNHIVNFVAEGTQAVTKLIAPTVESGMGIFMMFYGYRHMKGEIDQPFMQFVDTVLKVAAIAGVALGIGSYNTYIVKTFQDSPVALASALLSAAGTSAPSFTHYFASGSLSNGMGQLLDNILLKAYNAGMLFWHDASWYNPLGILVPAVVWFIGLLVTIFAASLLLLAKIETGIILALGPLFVTSLLFEKTKGFFEMFINSLVNRMLTLVLTVGVTSFLLSMFVQTADDLLAKGGTAQVFDTLAMIATGGVSLFILGHVPSLAASLGGGLSMSSFGFFATAKATGKGTKSAVKGGKALLGKARAHLSPNVIKQTAENGRERERLEPRKEMPQRSRTGT